MKVLITPVTGVVIALLGFASWRRQKVLERRLDWHERFHALLGKVSLAYMYADYSAGKLTPQDVHERIGTALQLTQELMATADEARIYGTQEGFDAAQKLRRNMADVLTKLPIRGGQMPTGLYMIIYGYCSEAQTALASEIRRRLGLTKLKDTELTVPQKGPPVAGRKAEETGPTQLPS